MIEAIQSEPLTSFIKKVRRSEPPRKPAIIIPVKTNRIKHLYNKPDEPGDQADIPFNEWTMPPQGDGYIKCARHDFL